jgi:uncharacterized protein YeaO (DUF488 family)
MVVIKRVYDAPSRDDGVRILVDRVWPRGVSRPAAKIAGWMRELGPSDQLRRFFGHDPARWREFARRYRAELKRREAAPLIAELIELARRGRLTIVYGARDREHNQAVVLKAVLDRRLRPRARRRSPATQVPARP